MLPREIEMDDSIKVLDLLIERISDASGIQEKEDLLKEVLRSDLFDKTELKNLLERPEVCRHLSLQHPLERKIESITFKQSEVWASNRSKAAILAELLLQVPVGEPPK
jgi:hypothetical protein